VWARKKERPKPSRNGCSRIFDFYFESTTLELSFYTLGVLQGQLTSLKKNGKKQRWRCSVSELSSIFKLAMFFHPLRLTSLLLYSFPRVCPALRPIDLQCIGRFDRVTSASFSFVSIYIYIQDRTRRERPVCFLVSACKRP
jgi:hypothetical protein